MLLKPTLKLGDRQFRHDGAFQSEDPTTATLLVNLFERGRRTEAEPLGAAQTMQAYRKAS